VGIVQIFPEERMACCPYPVCVGISLSLSELEEANDLVSHILCPREGESAKSTPRTFYNDYMADVHDDHGHSSQLRTSPSSAIWQRLD